MTLLCILKAGIADCACSAIIANSWSPGNAFLGWQGTDGSVLPTAGSWSMAHRLLSKVILNNCTYLVIYNTRISPMISQAFFKATSHFADVDVSLCSHFCTLQSKLHSKHDSSAVPGSRNLCSPGSHKHICLCRWTRSAKEHYLMMAAWQAKVAPSLLGN